MKEKPIIHEIKGKVTVKYRWSYGKHLSKFFIAMRDEKKLIGARCKNCKSVLYPYIHVCGRCFCETEDEPVVLSQTGTLVSWTTVYLSFPGQPKQPPYTYGLIRIDGADNAYHGIIDAPEEQLKPGLKLKVRWKQKRLGYPLDIDAWVPR